MLHSFKLPVSSTVKITINFMIEITQIRVMNSNLEWGCCDSSRSSVHKGMKLIVMVN